VIINAAFACGVSEGSTVGAVCIGIGIGVGILVGGTVGTGIGVSVVLGVGMGEVVGLGVGTPVGVMTSNLISCGMCFSKLVGGAVFCETVFSKSTRHETQLMRKMANTVWLQIFLYIKLTAKLIIHPKINHKMLHHIKCISLSFLLISNCSLRVNIKM